MDDILFNDLDSLETQIMHLFSATIVGRDYPEKQFYAELLRDSVDKLIKLLKEINKEVD